MKSLKSQNSASENLEIDHLSKKVEEQKAKCEEQAHSHEVAILHLRKEYEDLKVSWIHILCVGSFFRPQENFPYYYSLAFFNYTSSNTECHMKKLKLT